MIKNFLSVFVLACVFVGVMSCIACSLEETNKQINDINTKNNNKVIQNLSFFKNNKTGLCFAIWHGQSRESVMSNVPCVPEVEKILIK